MKRLLIVSPHFPPTAAPDMQRVRMSLAHYRAWGWEPTVLAVDPTDVAATQEAELLQTVPADVEVQRCRAWSRRWGLGTVGLRAVQPLYRAGSQLLRARHYDLVFFSTTQFITLVLGRRWRRRFGVPYVVDLQDPWRTGAYERPGASRPPGGWKYQFARLLAWWFEEHCYRGAAGFISVSPRYLEDLTGRYPWFPSKPQATIPFGASPNDFTVAQRLPLPPELPPRTPGEVRLVYTGAAGPILPHAATALFAALREFRRDQPARATQLRLLFLGTQYAQAGEARPALGELAGRYAVTDLVFELPQRLGYLQSLRCLREADGLLLLGSSDPAYSPSKLYPYYLAQKPMLAVVAAGSHLEQMVLDLACAQIARFTATEPPDATDPVIGRFFGQAGAGFPDLTVPRRNDALFAGSYALDTLVRRQTELFAQASGLNRPAALRPDGPNP